MKKNDPSSSKFWNDCYINKNIGWDLGGVTPVFKNWCDHLTQTSNILIPGAGNGYDPIYFATKGHKVTAVDFSIEAIKNMKKLAKLKNAKLNILNEDIFNLDKSFLNKFDYIVEYTFYCAIDRKKRKDYINLINKFLKKDGELIGLFLPILKKESDGGPPFSVNINKLIKDFSPSFDLIESKKHPLSIKSRMHNEHYLQFKKITKI